MPQQKGRIVGLLFPADIFLHFSFVFQHLWKLQGKIVETSQIQNGVI